MRIAILGTGEVGSTLGIAWSRKAGHSITFGSRDPAGGKAGALLSQMSNGTRVATHREAVARADVAVLATPWDGTEAVLAAVGDFGGKTLLDATNPLGFADGRLFLSIGHTTSGGEQVAGWANGAKVVKTLNQTTTENMADPECDGGRHMMFYATDHADAGKLAAKLVTDLGFEALDAGPLENARLLEQLAMLFIDQAVYRGQGRNFAFIRCVR